MISKKYIFMMIALWLIAEVIFLMTPLKLNFLVEPNEVERSPVKALSSNQLILALNGEELNLEPSLLPEVYRYESDSYELVQLQSVNFLQKDSYQSSLELWSQVEESAKSNLTLAQTQLSGEIFLPQWQQRSLDSSDDSEAIVARNLCYLEVMGSLNQRIGESYGLDIDFHQDRAGLSYEYQIGVDRAGRVQYILPLSRVEKEIHQLLMKALWQLPFASSATLEAIEWGRVRTEFNS